MIVVVGCGRSGTKYTSECIKAAGYDFRHERLGTYGGIGWNLALPHAIKKIASTHKDIVVLHQIRNPVDSIATLKAHGDVIWNRLEAVIPDLPNTNRLLCAMRYWYEYNIYCSRMAQYSYDVADLKLNSHVAMDLDAYGLCGKWGTVKTDINHRPHIDTTWRKLVDTDSLLAHKLMSAWEQFCSNRMLHFHEAVICL